MIFLFVYAVYFQYCWFLLKSVKTIKLLVDINCVCEWTQGKLSY